MSISSIVYDLTRQQAHVVCYSREPDLGGGAAICEPARRMRLGKGRLTFPRPILLVGSQIGPLSYSRGLLTK